VTAPIQYGTQTAPDPTAVMGRRTLAWIADLLLYAAVVAAGFASMSEYTDIPPGVADEEACDLLEQQNDDLPGGCIALDGTVYLLDTDESGIQTLLSLGWFAFFVVLQGVTGGSPGKLLFGLRVVDQYGNRCGIGRSLGRTLMWVVDAAPWLVPLVGPITAFTSTGHRRVGDLAAGTYVVASSSVGSPVMPGSAAPPPGQTAWGAPPPGWGAAPPTTTAGPGGTGWSSPSTAPTPQAPPPAAPQPDLTFPSPDVPDVRAPVDEPAPSVLPDEDWSRPPEVPTVPEPEWSAPTLPGVEDPLAGWQPPTDPGTSPPEAAPEPEPAPEPAPAPFAAPGAAGPPTAPAAPEPAAPRDELPPPQWDPARGTYLQWEPNRQAWLQWDAAGQRWKPIDS